MLAFAAETAIGKEAWRNETVRAAGQNMLHPQTVLSLCDAELPCFSHRVITPSSLPHQVEEDQLEKLECAALASVSQLVAASSCKPKHRRLDSQSGHVAGLWVWTPVRARTRGN